MTIGSSPTTNATQNSSNVVSQEQSGNHVANNNHSPQTQHEVNGQTLTVHQQASSNAPSNPSNVISISSPASRQSLASSDNSSASGNAAAFQPRFGADQVEVRAQGGRSKGNKALCGVFGFVGGLVTGALGAALGAVVGTLIAPGVGTIAGAAVGGAIMAGVGGFNGASLADKLTGLFGGRSQQTHMRAALNSLKRTGITFSRAEKNNLERVSDNDWRSLLHVPSRKVGDRTDRQKIREAVVLFVAKHGPAEAKAYKARLVSASGTQGQLQSEINRLKAGALLQHTERLTGMSNGSGQRTTALAKFMRGNRDMTTHPSALLTDPGFNSKSEHYGLQNALAVVGKIETTGVITEEDRKNLNYAMNPRGLNGTPSQAGDRDLLAGQVGRRMTPALKLRIANALYRNFGDNRSNYGLNLEHGDNRVLAQKFSAQSEQNVVTDEHYDRLDPGQRQQVKSTSQLANERMRAMAQVSRDVIDEYGQQIANALHRSMQQTAAEFRTPSQAAAEASQAAQPQVVQQRDESNLEVFKQVAAGCVPGAQANRFSELKDQVGLRDEDYDRDALTRAIKKSLMTEFGSYGEDLPDDGPDRDSRVDNAILRGIQSHIALRAMMTSTGMTQDRREALDGQINDLITE